MATAAVPRRAEIKTRTTDEVKRGATEVYARWGLSLNDAINTFLVKSIEIGGLPFDLRPEGAVLRRLLGINGLIALKLSGRYASTHRESGCPTPWAAARIG